MICKSNKVVAKAAGARSNIIDLHHSAYTVTLTWAFYKQYI